MTYLFWITLGILFYTYIGYGLLAWIGASLANRKNSRTAKIEEGEWPEVTLLVAAYNEEDCIEDKIRNSLQLDYPSGRLQLLFVTDGSTDSTNEIIERYPQVELLHQPERKGKIAAVGRAMAQVSTPLTVLTDANAMLNRDAIRHIVRPFRDPEVGAVAGEKRVQAGEEASAVGESLYWRYESALKKLDAQWYSVVGAAGELYAIRSHLFQEVPADTILDDFMQTLLIAKQGYRVAYAADACALESASAGTGEEIKRKVRICAGGFQSIQRLSSLLNPLQYGALSIQFVSHRVLRWTLAPLSLPLALFTNLALALSGSPIYQLLLMLQFTFYGLGLAGYAWGQRQAPFRGFFVPFYFLVMNLCAYRGFWRFLRKGQSVNWERARRAEVKTEALISD